MTTSPELKKELKASNVPRIISCEDENVTYLSVLRLGLGAIKVPPALSQCPDLKLANPHEIKLQVAAFKFHYATNTKINQHKISTRPNVRISLQETAYRSVSD